MEEPLPPLLLTTCRPPDTDREAVGDEKKDVAAGCDAAGNIFPPRDGGSGERGGKGAAGARGRIFRAEVAERGPVGGCGGLGGSGAVRTLSTPPGSEADGAASEASAAVEGVLKANEHWVLQMLSRRTASTPTSAMSWRQLFTRRDWHSAYQKVFLKHGIQKHQH